MRWRERSTTKHTASMPSNLQVTWLRAVPRRLQNMAKHVHTPNGISIASSIFVDWQTRPYSLDTHWMRPPIPDWPWEIIGWSPGTNLSWSFVQSQVDHSNKNLSLFHTRCKWDLKLLTDVAQTIEFCRLFHQFFYSFWEEVMMKTCITSLLF